MIKTKILNGSILFKFCLIEVWRFCSIMTSLVLDPTLALSVLTTWASDRWTELNLLLMYVLLDSRDAQVSNTGPQASFCRATSGVSLHSSWTDDHHGCNWYQVSESLDPLGGLAYLHKYIEHQKKIWLSRICIQLKGNFDGSIGWCKLYMQQVVV